MKAMVIREYGGPENFSLAELDIPAISAGQLLIKVAASSVNTVDTMIREMGKELPLSPDLPAVLGMDFAGTVESIADDVTGFQVGDEVYGCAGGLADIQGSLAEYMAVDAKLVARKAKNISMTEAAALPLVGITAFEGLKRAGVEAGQNVLVHGGSGGVGHVAVQLAQYFGANVSATSGTEQGMALIQSLGATAINYKSEAVADYVEAHTQGAGYDLVFDTVGGVNMLNSFEAAALNAQVATTVSLLELDLTLAHFKGLSVHVVFMLIPLLYNQGREVHGQILSTLTELVENDHLRPVLDDSTYSLSQVGEAHARLSSGQALGKVVIDHQL